MSKTPDSDTTDEASGIGNATRRDVMKAAGAGVAGLAAGTTLSGTASAQNIPTPQLSVDGNVFVDPEGNTVTLRGANIVDPRRADVLAPTRGKTAPQMVDQLTEGEDWQAQVIRVPMQPNDIAEDPTAYCNGEATPVSFTEEELRTYLSDHVDPVVQRCKEQGAYVILDYHRHWTGSSVQNNNTEFDGNWDTDLPLQEEVVMFWDVVASEYGDESHTLFEVYNEPTEPGMWEDPATTPWVAENWYAFVDFIQPAVDQIEEHTDNPILLGSPSWTQSPEGILLTEDDVPDHHDFNQLDEPENLAMTFHIYAGHQSSQQGDWDDASINGEGVSRVYEEYPLVVTEFGWDNELNSSPGGDNPVGGSDSSFGEPFLEWLESDIREDAVSWTAWCGDIWWDSAMFERAFEGTDSDICEPYNVDVPQDCEELPCEWELKTGPDFMGDDIQQTLIDYQDHNNPAGTTDPVGPSPPSGLSVSPGTTSLDVSWNSVSDANSYNVTVDGSTESTSSTSLTVSGLEPATQYTVEVTAESDDGESDPVSETVSTNEDTGGDCGDGESMEVDGQTVCDVDGDGYYRDATGDGNVDQDDVTAFFENQHRSAWNQDAFDFSGNGEVNQFDVTELFDYTLQN